MGQVEQKSGSLILTVVPSPQVKEIVRSCILLVIPARDIMVIFLASKMKGGYPVALGFRESNKPLNPRPSQRLSGLLVRVLQPF